MSGIFAARGLDSEAANRLFRAAPWRGAAHAVESDGTAIGTWRNEASSVSLASGAGVHAAVHGGFFGSPADGAAARLLEAWSRGGAAEAARLDGEFAWIVVAGERLALSRDAFGAKPLFYGRDGDRAAAASAIAAVRASGLVRAGPDFEVLRFFARGEAPAGPRTSWTGIRRVLPGEIVVLDPGRVTVAVERWRPRSSVRWSATATAEAASIPGEISRAVAKRRWSKPAIALGGGMDSPSLAATMWGDPGLERDVSAGDGLPAVTLGFPGRPCDESARVDALTRRYGRAAIRRDASRADVLGESERLARECDEPLPGATGYHLPLLAEAARGAGCRTLVMGYGGDDLYTGGPLAAAEFLQRGLVLRAWSALGAPSAAAIRRNAVAPLAARIAGRGGTGLGSAAWDARWRGLRALHDSSLFEAIESTLERRETSFSAPLLDRELFETSLSRPFALLAPGGGYKELLRDAMKGRLPDELLDGRRTVFDDEVGSALVEAERVLGARGSWASRAVPARRSRETTVPSWGELAVELWWRTHVA